MPISSLILGDDVPALRQVVEHGVEGPDDATWQNLQRQTDGNAAPRADRAQAPPNDGPAYPPAGFRHPYLGGRQNLPSSLASSEDQATPRPQASAHTSFFATPIPRPTGALPAGSPPPAPKNAATEQQAPLRAAAPERATPIRRPDMPRAGFAKFLGIVPYLSLAKPAHDPEHGSSYTGSGSSGDSLAPQEPGPSTPVVNNALPNLRRLSIGSATSSIDDLPHDLSASWASSVSAADPDSPSALRRSPSRSSSAHSPSAQVRFTGPYGVSLRGRRHPSSSAESLSGGLQARNASRRGGAGFTPLSAGTPGREDAGPTYFGGAPFVSSPLATPDGSRAPSPVGSDDGYVPRPSALRGDPSIHTTSSDSFTSYVSSHLAQTSSQSTRISFDLSSSNTSFFAQPTSPDASVPQTADDSPPWPEGPGPYFHQEIKARVAAAVAVHRDFLSPSPITHLAHCLAPSGDYAAVMAPAGVLGLHDAVGFDDPLDVVAQTLRVATMGLCAPEATLDPSTANQALPPYALYDGLNREPPMGRRAAVSLPLEPVMGLPPFAPGTQLLACAFDFRPPRQGLSSDRKRNVIGVVVAHPQDASGVSLVQWLSGPISSYAWQQNLIRVHNPSAFFSPKAQALVISSLDDAPSAHGVKRVRDGVYLLHADPNRPHWRLPLRNDRLESLAASGDIAPSITFDANDSAYVVVDCHQAVVRPMPKYQGPTFTLPAPQALAGCTERWGEGVSWDATGRWLAVNFAGSHRMGLARWGDVWDLMPPHNPAHGLRTPQKLDHEPHTYAPGIYRMAHFDGVGEQVILAYPTSMYRCPMDRIQGHKLMPHSQTGYLRMRTEAEHKELITFAKSPYFAMLWQDGLRMVYPTHTRHFGMSQVRYSLREWRPEYVSALHEIGEHPSNNTVTVRPWLSADGRYLFTGFDDDTVHRWDFAPSAGHKIPYLFDPAARDHPAMRNVAITRWSDGPDPQDVLNEREARHAQRVAANAQREARPAD